jgi:hypothetical protein
MSISSSAGFSAKHETKRKISSMLQQDRLEPLIGTIIADPFIHACWVNTFSFLEYVGFRKIIKSQKAEALTGTILTHAVEEGRHALGLKKLAIRLGGPAFDLYAPETMLCGEEAETYFQDLDAACDEAFSERSAEDRARLGYYAVTFLVEKRALRVYGLYKKGLGESPVASKLDGLLAEETRHLSDVESWLFSADTGFSAKSDQLAAIETALYERFIDALSRDLARRNAPALA